MRLERLPITVAIRNVGHLEVPTFHVIQPFIKCYGVHFKYLLPFVFYCVLSAAFLFINLTIQLSYYSNQTWLLLKSLFQ